MSRRIRRDGAAAGRLAFIINPIAGGGRALRGYRSVWPSVCRSAPADDYISRERGEATRMAARAVGLGYDAVFAVGGDGTLHEVVNGLLRTGLRGGVYRGPPLGLLPLGRGNDFARTFGVWGGLGDVWSHQVANIIADRRRIDVGRARIGNDTHSHFVNMCGVGFDADVAATANRIPRVFGGVLPYLAGILLHFTIMRSHGLEVQLEDVQPLTAPGTGGWPEAAERVSEDGKRKVIVRDRLLLALTGVGKFIGGGMKLLPYACPDDGYLDIMMARPVGRLRFLGILRKSFTGGHIGQSDVAYYRTRRVIIRPSTEANIHADGDHIGRGDLTIEVLPRALPVLF